MNHAKKLRLSITPCDFDRSGKIIGRHAFTKDAPQGRLVRKYTPKNQIEMFERAIPDILKKHLLAINYSEIHLLKAHVHITDESVINFYQHTGGEVTTFWDGLIEPDDSFASDNGNNYFNLHHKNLNPCESFIAQDGDVWLLNTRQPHSVSKSYFVRPEDEHFMVDECNKPRYVVQAFFDAKFSQVAEILKKFKLIAEDVHG